MAKADKTKINLNLIPASKRKEQLVLGLIIESEGELLNHLVSPGHFYYADHQRLFYALKDMKELGLKIDELTLLEFLKESGNEGEVDYTLIQSCMTDIAFYRDFAQYINYLEMYRQRRIVLAKLHAIISEPEKHSNQRIYKTFLDLENIIIQDAQIIQTEQLMHGQHNGIAMKSNIATLDRMVNFASGDYVVIGADPRRGKTSLALCMAIAMQEYNPLFISAEMGRRRIAERMATIETKIPLQNLINDVTFDLNAYEFQSKKINWLFAPAINTTQIAMKVNAAVNIYNTKVVFIDHLQLLRCEFERGISYNRNAELTRISAQLNAVAKNNDVLLVILSQLNRQAESQKRKPGLRDIRESGAVEQDADTVILLWEHPAAEKNFPPVQTLVVAKQRQGAEGETETLKFKKELFTWS